jgi:hypothetical protein
VHALGLALLLRLPENAANSLKRLRYSTIIRMFKESELYKRSRGSMITGTCHVRGQRRQSEQAASEAPPRALAQLLLFVRATCMDLGSARSRAANPEMCRLGSAERRAQWRSLVAAGPRPERRPATEEE